MRTKNLYVPEKMAMAVAILFFVGLFSVLAGCSKKSNETAAPSTSSTASASATATTTTTDAGAKRYKLTGKVLSVDKSGKFAQIASNDIPGFMSAMTMNYPVVDVSQLDKVAAGDEIAADIVVTSDGFHLENIVVTKKGSGAPAATPSSEEMHIPQPGDVVPDFALTNQNGKRIRLKSFHGDVLLVTFIYTKCPFPNFCPLVSKNFAHIYADAKSDPTLGSKLRLLTVSFDPQHDTPPVLRKYAASFDSITKEQSPFQRWEFATASPAELKKMSDFFGVTYEERQGLLVHSMSTSVITPDGKIYKWYDDSTWKPDDLKKDASEALLQDDTSSSTVAQARLRLPIPSGSEQTN